MATKLTKVVANFETSLATKLANGATSGALTSITDKNGTALPTGKYCMIVDRGTGDEEHLLFDLSGTTISNIISVTRQAVQTAGVQNINGHRAGSKCYLTDFINIKVMVDIMNGDDTLDGSKPIKYDSSPIFNDDHQLIEKKYVDDIALIKVGKTGNENVAGVKTFQDRPIFQQGFTSNTPATGADPVVGTDLATRQWVLGLAFGASLISGLNSPQINYDQNGRVRSIHDEDNGKTYVFIYDAGSDTLRGIYDGISTWAIFYHTNGRLKAVSKH